MKYHPSLYRLSGILLVSLLILIVVLQFAPAAHAPTEPAARLTTRVAAANARVTVTAPADSIAVQVPPPQARPGTLFFSADRAGRYELYAAAPQSAGDPAQWRQLTRGYSPARSPAVSPDGTRLAFQSRKDGNWEIYVLDLQSGAVTRLTNAPAYDGAPAWSPDGKQIAFESYRAQDLDIWRMNSDGTGAVNLTPDEPAYDYGPAWSPDGKTIVFTSWASGQKQLYSMTPDGKNLTNLSHDRFANEQPAWSPDGRRLAFISNREGCAVQVESSLEAPPPPGSADSGNCERRTLWLGDYAGGSLTNLRQIAFDGRDAHPTWSPDGKMLLFVSTRPARQALFAVPAAGGLAEDLTGGAAWLDSAVWASRPVPEIGSAPVDEPALYIEKPIPSQPGEGTVYDFVGMKEVYLAPSWGILSSTVSESYRALRQRILQESGIDFLNTLSDMTRLINSRCDNTCDDLSWHKSGRAVDTLLSLPREGKEELALVREDAFGEVYWRVYLRAAKQDGSQGEPIKDAPWDLSYSARATVAPGMGGVEGSVEPGYFVDLTDLARQYGWERISSHDDPTFDWRTNRQALEFWHFQKEDGLTWWQAMQQVYAPGALRETFDWNTIVNTWGTEPLRVYLKSVPPPPDAWKWYALVPVP